MKVFVLVNAILELVVGMVLFLSPDVLPELQGESALAHTLTRMYGGAALALGYYALMVWRNFNTGPVYGFLKTFVVFHIAVAVAAFFGYSQGIPTFIAVCVLHGVLGLITAYFLVKK